MMMATDLNGCGCSAVSGAQGATPENVQAAYGVMSLVGGATSVYHGYKRTGSAGWAFGWLVFGSMFPIFAVPLALAQGYAKPKKKRTRR
jgi:hypothetical protein